MCFLNSLTFHVLCRHSQTATSRTLLVILRNNKTRKVGGTWKLTWKLIGGKCGRGVGTNMLTYLQSVSGEQQFVICGPWTSCGPRTFSWWCACACSPPPHTHTFVLTCQRLIFRLDRAASQRKRDVSGSPKRTFTSPQAVVTRNHSNHTTTWPLLSHSNRKKMTT